MKPIILITTLITLTLSACSPQQHQTISDVATIVETVDLLI